MRILLLNFERGWRGGERQTLLCLQQFRAAGHKVALLARSNGDLALAAQQAGITVYEENSPLAACIKLLRLRAQYDVFHAQTANTFTWLALFKPFLKGKVAFTRRTAFSVTKRAAITAWKWRKADLFVAISQAAALEPQRLGVPVHVVIPSTVLFHEPDNNNIDSLRSKLTRPGVFTIATVAALTPEKDPATVIKAIHKLSQMRNDFRFLHFGSMGSSEIEARDLVVRLGLQERYKFVGFRADITDCYRLMDVFVLGSKHEALGSSVLDAFLYGVPVVATNAGGLRELVANERGLSCPIGDFDCMANNINRLLNSPELCIKLRSNAHKFVEQEHSPLNMSQRYLDAYHKL